MRLGQLLICSWVCRVYGMSMDFVGMGAGMKSPSRILQQEGRDMGFVGMDMWGKIIGTPQGPFYLIHAPTATTMGVAGCLSMLTDGMLRCQVCMTVLDWG